MKIYYAHSISLYDTQQELRDLGLLRQLEFEIINPNELTHDAGYKEHGMPYFKGLLDACDALAFRANPGGSINAGVAWEIQYMIERNKPVIELPSMMDRQILSVEATRSYLREVGHR